MSFFRKAVDAMQGYAPGLQPSDNLALKLNTNENPYPPSERVLVAIAIESSRLRLYPDPDSTPFRLAAARLNNVDPDCVIAGNGSDELLTILCRSVVGPGDRVYFPSPTYTLYDVLVDIQEGVNCPVDFPDDFSLPQPLFANPGVLTFVANPNSPSGTLLQPDELARLARSLKGLLVIDEAYVDFAPFNCVPLLRDHPNVVILRTLSKSYSLAGLRVGYALASPEVVLRLNKVRDSYNLDRLAVAGAAAALNDSEYMRANAARICLTRRTLVDALDKLGFTTLPSHANFVLTAPPPPLNAELLFRRLWDRKILVRYFNLPRLDNFLRITVGSDDQMDLLLDALAHIQAAALGS